MKDIWVVPTALFADINAGFNPNAYLQAGIDGSLRTPILCLQLRRRLRRLRQLCGVDEGWTQIRKVTLASELPCSFLSSLPCLASFSWISFSTSSSSSESCPGRPTPPMNPEPHVLGSQKDGILSLRPLSHEQQCDVLPQVGLLPSAIGFWLPLSTRCTAGIGCMLAMLSRS